MKFPTRKKHLTKTSTKYDIKIWNAKGIAIKISNKKQGPILSLYKIISKNYN